MKNKVIIIISILVVTIFCIACIYFYKIDNKNMLNNEDKLDVSQDKVNNVEDIQIFNDKSNIENITFEEEESYAIELNDTLNITKGGVYILTGNITNGQIYIDTKDNVKLILKNVSIVNKNGPAIMVENANAVYIEVSEETTNYLKDGESYILDEESEPNATIFSKDDLVLCGDGKLVIEANYKDAIASKDNLKILNGIYEITAKDEGIRGKDSIVIEGGNFNITSKSDSIKSTNETEENKGYIIINDGTFNLNSSGDGISSASDLNINGGTFNIVTNGGFENNDNQHAMDDFRNFKNMQNSLVEVQDDSISTKAIKSQNNMVINGGSLEINSCDDAIHSNNYIGIAGGIFNIKSGDDGFHADSKIIIDAGNIKLLNSYEGIEAENVVINDGEIYVISEDDGINISGGMDNTSFYGRENNKMLLENINEFSNSNLTINGGKIYVNASGDGLDSNGDIYINGGVIIVNGPTNNGNGSLDYANSCKITSGLFIASGSSGMAQGFSNDSTQANVSITFENQIEKGNIISIKNKDGEEVITYEADKNYQNIVISSPKLQKDSIYYIYTNAQVNTQSENGIYESSQIKEENMYLEMQIKDVCNSFGKGGSNNMFDRKDVGMPPNGSKPMENKIPRR